MIEKEIIKYNKRIYRKLYLYALMVMIASMVLSVFITGLFFRASERKMFEKHLRSHSITLKRALNEMNLTKYKDAFPVEKKIIISDRPGLAMEYIPSIEKLRQKKNISNESIKLLLETKEPQTMTVEHNMPAIILFLNDKNDSNGILYVEDFGLGSGPKPNLPPKNDRRIRPEFLSAIFILTSLSILLIPYSRYIFKPFRDIMYSIQRVSSGDFNTIDVSTKSDFRGLAESFNNMTRKIQEMIQQRDRLIADVSHELRTPLTRIRLALELLDKEGKGKKKYIDKSINEIIQLDKMIDDILDSSKLELNKNDFIFEKACLQKLLEENIEKNTILFQENNIIIDTDFIDQDIYIKANKQLFERALGNIFSNLTKYSPNGSKADINIHKKDKNVIVTIRDRGEGVKDNEYDKIFQPFYRSDLSRSRKTGGTGLGLSIVRQIIMLHDGEILAEKTDDNIGLIIKIILPIL